VRRSGTRPREKNRNDDDFCRNARASFWSSSERTSTITSATTYARRRANAELVPFFGRLLPRALSPVHPLPADRIARTGKSDSFRRGSSFADVTVSWPKELGVARAYRVQTVRAARLALPVLRASDAKIAADNCL